MKPTGKRRKRQGYGVADIRQPRIPDGKLLFLLIWALATTLPFTKATAQAKDTDILYVGTFSERGSQGIYVYRMNGFADSAELVQTIGGMESPSFLALHPDGRTLYSANRSPAVPGRDWGSIASFAVDPVSGLLTSVSERPAYGSGSCHISTDWSGAMLFVANYSAGNMAAFSLADPRHPERIGQFDYEGHSIHPTRQESAHAHACLPSPDNRYLYVTDLGTDRIYGYRLAPGKSRLRLVKKAGATVDPGSGPRHLTFHPNGRYVFLAEELSSTVSTFRYHPKTGRLTLIDRQSTLPPGFDRENAVADVHVHPNGRFLYVSNRGHNSVAIFSIDPATGRLTPLGHEPVHGDHPRNFTIHPGGEFLLVANRTTDNITFFRIDPATGRLSYTGQEIKVPAPVCLVWGKRE